MLENFGRRSRMLRHPPARLDGIKFRSGTAQLPECDCFELNRRGCWLTSPRLRGEVGSLRAMQSIVRSNPGEGTIRESESVERPLTPTLSPQERGEGADRNPVMTRIQLTARAATFTVPMILSVPPISPLHSAPHVLHHHALDSLHHYRGAGAGRAQRDAAAIDRAARHLGRHQYPLSVRLSVLDCVLQRRAGCDRRPCAMADGRVLAMAVARRAQPDPCYRTDAARHER